MGVSPRALAHLCLIGPFCLCTFRRLAGQAQFTFVILPYHLRQMVGHFYVTGRVPRLPCRYIRTEYAPRLPRIFPPTAAASTLMPDLAQEPSHFLKPTAVRKDDSLLASCCEVNSSPSWDARASRRSHNSDT